MSLWRQITRGLRVLTSGTTADREVAEEVEHYFERAAADLEASGLSPDEARRAARLELGTVTAVREQVRAYGWENGVAAFFADLRYAARQMRRDPGSAVVSMLMLAMGIGASTAIFSAVKPILFESLPYPHADRVMMIWDIFNGARSDVTFHSYRELQARSRSFETIAVLKPWQPTMTGPAEPERFDGQSVSATYFQVLGVKPTVGRDFQLSDDVINGPKVVIISHGLWQRRFGGDRAIVGRLITLDGDGYVVIGVMPRDFENVLAASAEIWVPLQYDTRHITSLDTPEWGHHLRMVGRLRPGLRTEAAGREFDMIARAPVPEFPRPRWASLKYGLLVNSLQDEVTRGVKPALLAVLGAVMMVLLIAGVNVANIQLARGAQRRGEFSMRAALGAGRIRIFRQLVTESLLLAVIGGALGMVVAEFGVRALVAVSPPELPRAHAIAVDHTALAFAFGISALIGLLVGLIPAANASRIDLRTGVQQSSRQTTGGHQVMRRALVVVEVALALVLLVSAGLLLRSLERLFAVDPGFDTSRVLTMQVQTSGHRFEDSGVRLRFFAQALEAARNVPGVTAAAFTSLLPLSGEQYGEYGTRFEDGNGYNVFRYVVTPGYFETLSIPLRQGRLLDDHDVAGAIQAVLISESLAKSEFPGRDPIGQRVHVGPVDRPWYTIVGVVADVRQTSLAVSDSNAAYITPTQSWFADEAMSLVIRARSDAAALAPAIRKAIWSVDKDQPIVQVATMEELLSATAAERHFALILFEVFGVVALGLASIGIYGVLSGYVTERTQEIGVWSALGASRAMILALVVRQGLMLTAVGVVIGLVGAVAASSALVTLLFGLSRLDPTTYLGVLALLFGMSAVACWFPAWRATRINPSISLRAE